jgi:hypothetical protein
LGHHTASLELFSSPSASLLFIGRDFQTRLLSTPLFLNFESSTQGRAQLVVTETAGRTESQGIFGIFLEKSKRGRRMDTGASTSSKRAVGNTNQAHHESTMDRAVEWGVEAFEFFEAVQPTKEVVTEDHFEKAIGLLSLGLTGFTDRSSLALGPDYGFGGVNINGKGSGAGYGRQRHQRGDMIKDHALRFPSLTASQPDPQATSATMTTPGATEAMPVGVAAQSMAVISTIVMPRAKSASSAYSVADPTKPTVPTALRALRAPTRSQRIRDCSAM